MATLNGNIVGAAANGSLHTKSKIGKIYSTGFRADVVPKSVHGYEMSYLVGLLSTNSSAVDIYRWGTWRINDGHGSVFGYISDRYQYGERTKLGQPNEWNLIPTTKVSSNVRNAIGLIRETIRGLKVKENYEGYELVQKVNIPIHQNNLIGKTWGDWTDNGNGGGTSTPIRYRKYPDTHIPRRREDS